jgi:hypothetical protein
VRRFADAGNIHEPVVLVLKTGLGTAVVDVDMDGVWRQATRDDQLTTEGVASCVAVAVADDAAGKAWLMDGPTFGQNSADLHAMLGEAVVHTSPREVKIWAFGAATEVGCDDDET